ncbi:MAG TPA: TolC family protein [Gammaproteobacteria bacterium]|nr:TolC family protein [Gammaproteobacteria bacterium]
MWTLRKRTAALVVLAAAACVGVPAWAGGTTPGPGQGAGQMGVQDRAASGVTQSHEHGPGEGSPPPTLQDVLAAAFARSPQRQVLDARGRQVQALTRHADSLIADNPAVSLRYQSDRFGSDQGLREYEAGIDLPLWRPGERDANLGVARRAYDALTGSQAALRLQVAGQVREAVWQVALMHNNAVLAEQEWRTAQALEQDVAKRVRLGELAKTDLLLARDEALRKQSAYLQAEAEWRHSQDQYRALTGLDRLPRKRGEARSPRSTIVPEHPLFVEAQANVAEAQAQLEAARQASGGSPELTIGGRRERGFVAENYISSVGVSVRVPFGTEAHTGPRISRAARAYADALAERDRLQRRLRVALHEAEHTLSATEESLKIAEEQNALARENLRLARVAFSVGETDLVGLLRVQTLAFAAQRSEQELRIMRQRAIARYNQAVGVLP